MEHRQLGRSGLRVPVLAFGAGTFGGSGDLFRHWGSTEVAEARAIVDLCLEHGVTLFDTADVYSDGASERVLGEALEGRRDDVLVATKIGLPTGDGPMDRGASRHRLRRSVEASLRRLRTDRIDVLHLHAYDASTPVEETWSALAGMVADGTIGYVGVSNWSAWRTMRAIAVADRYGWPRPVSQQIYYSLVGRDAEWDLLPFGRDEGVGAMVWSPLAWGRLTGRIRRGEPIPATSRLHATAAAGPPVDDERLFDVVDVLQRIADEVDRTVPQVALRWLVQRPTVASVVVGARDRGQLMENLGALGWSLEDRHMRELDAVSLVDAPYPHFPARRQEAFALLDPPL